MLVLGTMIAAPAVDYHGNLRPLPAGTRPDIGAVEELVTGVDDMGVLPVRYALSQNYPNPFNPSTLIEFALPHAGYVTLSVHNILGQEVATLIAGEHTAGAFKVTWDASGLPSGVYFYRLTAGGYVQTMKMVLMK
jgi:hypothetical protein